jgi:hypothetical protein
LLDTATDDSSSYAYTYDADNHVATVDNNGVSVRWNPLAEGREWGAK